MSEADLKLLHTRELLAFRLFSFNLVTKDGAAVFTEDRCRDVWQDLGEDERASWRKAATDWVADLDKMGIATRMSSSSQSTKAIEYLLTVPPRTAYSLPAIVPPAPVAPPAAPKN